MSRPTINQIRRQFIDFFDARGHTPVASSNLVPANDDTLLFTNAGMVQFKEALLGLESRPYSRAVTSQKCLRVSGKHNDLEEVGVSPRHHTFFEMLGNFSFGDYFKQDAIRFAWELVVETWELPLERLWFSILDGDDESEQLWRDVGAAPDRIRKFDRKDNWWSMGETGPCGPCSEIHYYWGDLADQHPDGVNRDDEYLEFWNLVFMQYDQITPETLEPLAQPGVDTGAGLERVASILQGCETTYDTDAFLFLMDRVQELAGQTDAQRRANEVPYRVIADHSRAIAFLISDGVLPGNEGRNYITRLILRRAARFGRVLGLEEPFMARVVESVINEMGHHFTELSERRTFICDTITAEETRFLRTLANGLNHLETMMAEVRAREETEISGDQSFLLWDTFGFPLDLTRDLARERGLTVGETRFRELADQAKARSRRQAGGQNVQLTVLYGGLLTDLQRNGLLAEEGVHHRIYDRTATVEGTLLAILRAGETVETAAAGDEVEVVLASTPFYVEAGGQVSDTGTIESTSSDQPWSLRVEDLHRPVSGLIVHRCTVAQGTPRAGDAAVCHIDRHRRTGIERNHTATHILHAQLRNVLGTTVHQAGSLVAPDRLRFDFTFNRAMTAAEIAAVEQAARTVILANEPVDDSWETYDDAVAGGAMALFGEKYDDIVRVVRVGDCDPSSQELCGGTHVRTTAEIGSFHIVSESSSAAGQRRIEAVTGEAANAYVDQAFQRVSDIASLLKTQPDMAVRTVESLIARHGQLRRELQASQQVQAQAGVQALVEHTELIQGIPCVIAEIQARDVDMMRDMCDRIQDRLDAGVVALGAGINAKPMLTVSVAKSLADQGLHAGRIVRQAASRIGGGGGGRQNMAQAGGRNVGGLADALAVVRETIRTQVG